MRYYFIGIKGAGMSALAQILHDAGHHVSGSDVEEHFFTEEGLRNRSIELYPFDAENIERLATEDMKCIIVKGNAFKDTHVEVQKAHELGCTVLSYLEMIDAHARNYRSIAVSGTHGKTTTTSMLAEALRDEKTGYLIGDGTGHASKEDVFFAFEACEYKGHFTTYHPDVAIITNIEFDHPDYFKDLKAVQEEFYRFMINVRDTLIVCGDDTNILEITKKEDITARIVTYGVGEHNIYNARNILKRSKGNTFDVYVQNTYLTTIETNLYGEHNIQNTLAVCAVLHTEGFSAEYIAKHLQTFHGAKRRFSIIETGYQNQILLDDYAHHPTELKATYEAIAQKYPDMKKIIVFQSHTYSRTYELKDEFAEVLMQFDKVYIAPIFGSAREKEGKITTEEFCATMKGASCITLDSLDVLKEEQDAIIGFVGAGNINDYLAAYALRLK